MAERKPCRPRHRYRGQSHGGGCPSERWPHWHVTCRRCGYAWMQAALFDNRPFEVAA